MSQEKQAEFLAENIKLKNTLNVINNETLSFIARRQYISDYIRKYREQILEEYKDDEDKVAEYFDHELYVKEEAYSTIDRKLKELTILKESPYFGRINFEDELSGELDNIYIGRFGLTEEGSYEPEIVDWRAPIASLFYHGGLGKAQYTAPDGKVDVDILGRRQLIVKKGQLKGIFDSAIDVKDEILQMVLSSNSNEKLQDIVMTIQEEQDKIIRASRSKTIVVNGVAGSGKTTIALHRVAYLLYNYRKELEGKVLILGPNSIFMEYISQVLPTLGETGVMQETFTNYAIEEIGLKESIIEYNEFLERVIGGDKEFIEDAKKKYSSEFIKELDDFIAYLEKNYFTFEQVKYFDEVIVDTDEINELYTNYYAYMPLFRRTQKMKRIIESKIKDKRNELVYKFDKELADTKASLSEEQLALVESDMDFRRNIRIREIVRESMDAKKRVASFLDNESIVELYKKFIKKERLSVFDLAPILYLMIKLDGKKAKNQFRHIIIDEAQDYSSLQFIVIRELTDCKHFTIVGDSNQRIVKFTEKAPMLDLCNVWNEKDIEHYELSKSYRSTYEIMQYANQYLNEEKIVPIVRNGKPVVTIKAESDEEIRDAVVDSINEFREEGFESIAVITKDVDELERINKIVNDRIHLFKFDNEYVIYRGGIVIIPSYYAKGLEFDAVVMIDSDKEEKKEDLIKYVISTRALHALTNVKIK